MVRLDKEIGNKIKTKTTLLQGGKVIKNCFVVRSMQRDEQTIVAR